MKMVLLSSLSLIISLAIGSAVACAQPKGWAFDYGFRPGNTWFYTSMGDTTVWSITALRDSMGADGVYWIYMEIPRFMGAYWCRIDTLGNFDEMLDPLLPHPSRVFRVGAEIGDAWRVDTNKYGPTADYARVTRTYRSMVHHMTEVTYYTVTELGTVAEPGMREWTERVGITRMQGHAGDLYELAGRIIDGVRYGNTSGVEEMEESPTGSDGLPHLSSLDEDARIDDSTTPQSRRSRS